MTLTIEMLYPEVANLHGDNFNITYLGQCRPDAQIIRTHLTEVPAFATKHVDLVYLGPMPETIQVKALEHLRSHKDRLGDLIESGTAFLFTHNAMEILGETLQTWDGQEVPGLGIFPLRTHLDLFKRYAGKVLGHIDQAEDPTSGPDPLAGPTSGPDPLVEPIVGYKVQFSMIEAQDTLPGFLTAVRGIGRNKSTRVEGVRRKNFIGTSLVGPLLINNPGFTKHLLTLLDPTTEPVLAHQDLITAAYQARLADFTDPRRWHPTEEVPTT